MSVSLFVKRAAFGSKNKIGILTIEATVSETHSYQSRVTRHPVQEGNDIADHIVNEPKIVEISGFISNNPISVGLGDRIFDRLSFLDRAQRAFDILEEIRDEKELVTVVTYYKIYQDMAITNVRVPRTPQTGNGIAFTVQLQKIDKVGAFGFDAIDRLFAPITQPLTGLRRTINLGRKTGLNVAGRVVNNVGRILRGIV